jgi:hypothetical protein
LVLRASFSSAVNCSREVLTKDLLNRDSVKGLKRLSDLTRTSRPAGVEGQGGAGRDSSSQPAVRRSSSSSHHEAHVTRIQSV